MSNSTRSFRYRSQASSTSQKGKIWEYLNKLDSEDRNSKVYKAIEHHYLVEALESEGIREREDLKKIGYRCAEELKAQARAIERSLGLESSTTEERPYFSQPQQFHAVAAPIEQTPSEPEPESPEEEEDEYDYKSDPRYANPKKIEMSDEKEKELLEGFMNSI